MKRKTDFFKTIQNREVTGITDFRHPLIENKVKKLLAEMANEILANQEKNPKRSLALLKQAAELGCLESCEQLESLYRGWVYLGEPFYTGTLKKKNFDGIFEIDLELSLYYIDLRIFYGDSDAAVSAGTFFLDETVYKKDEKKALEYFKKAAFLGNETGVDYLNKMYLGKGFTGALLVFETIPYSPNVLEAIREIARLSKKEVADVALNVLNEIELITSNNKVVFN